MPTSYESDALANDLLAKEGGSFLRLIGGVLDTPGSTIRNTLALRNPLRGLFDLDERISGRALAEKLGIPENTPGLDTGDVLGFLAEVALDPLTYLSFGSSALTKSGKVAKMSGMMPTEAIEAVTGRLSGPGRRTLSRTKTLADQIGLASPSQQVHASRVAEGLGTNLDDLLKSAEPLQRDVAIGIPFGPELGTFNVPGSRYLAETADKYANKMRTSKPGALAYRLFNKDSRTASTVPVQIAMEDASKGIDADKLENRRIAAETRMAVAKSGMTPEEYSRFMRGALEMVDPDSATKVGSIEEAVTANLPERLRTPETIADLTKRIDYIQSDTNSVWEVQKDSGRGVPKTKQERTAFFPRLATDPDKLRLGRGETVGQLRERGARTFVDMPGGSNTISDAMSDSELWDMMQGAFKQNDVTTAPRQGQLDALEAAGVEDLEDLTRHQAGRMLKQGEQMGEISRTQSPPNAYSRTVPDEAKALVATRYFKWSPETLEAFQQAKSLPKDKLDEASQGVLDAYEAQWEQADLLARSVGARKEDLVKSKRPYYWNDPLVDWLDYREHALEQSQYAKQLYKVVAGAAKHITHDPEMIEALAKSGFQGEFPPGMAPEGWVPLKQVLAEIVTPVGKKKNPAAWNNSVNMSYAIKAIAPDLAHNGIIDVDTLDNMIGEHAVYESGLDAMRAAASEGASRAAAVPLDEAVESLLAGQLSLKDMLSQLRAGEATAGSLADTLSESQVLKYDGLLELNRIMVPASLMEDAGRVMDTLADRGYMSSILKGYDKALNLTKAHLTVNFPGFHVRNAYSMLWQMIVSGSYDPAFKRWDPRAYLNPLREAGKLVRGEYIEDAAKYFPGTTISNEEAMERLREVAFAHNTATGQYVFHSEAADVVGMGGGQATPDLLAHMPGTIPEGNPGVAGLGYLWDGWKKLWKGTSSEKNPLNVLGVKVGDDGKMFGPYAGGQKTATYVESIGRTATMMARMKQGWAPDLAAAASNAAHVDYSSLSTFERQVMKRVIPFYSYASRMVPWTLKNLAEHPGGVTAQSIRAFEDAKGEGGFVPDFLQGSLAMPIGGVGDDGKQTFVTGVDLPFESLNDYIQYGPTVLDTVGRTLRQAGGQLSPYIQAPIELAMGQTFYQGRNLKDVDPALGRILANITGQEDPVMNMGLTDQILAKSPVSRYLSTIRQITDMRDPIIEQAIKKPIHTFTGVRFKDVNMEQQTNFAVLDAIKEQVRGDRPFVTGDYVTVKKENLPKLTDRQKKLLELYRERSQRLRERP